MNAWLPGTRVRGFTGSRVRGFAGTRVRGFAGSRGSRGSRVRGFAGPRVHGFVGFARFARIPRAIMFLNGIHGSDFSALEGGGEVCDSCQCSHMSNMPMHDVRMLKVLVWTQ